MKTIKQLRAMTGITQTQVAELMQLKRGGKGFQAAISNLESGRISPTVRRLYDYSRALGYTLTLQVKGPSGPPIQLDLESLLGHEKSDPSLSEDSTLIPDPISDPVPTQLEDLTTLLSSILTK